MTQLSQYLEDLTAEWLRGTNFPTAPISLDIALSTSDPLDDASGLSEPSGGYSRQTITFAASTVSASGVLLESNINISFPTATLDWGTITHIAIFSGSDMLFFSALNVPKQIRTGDDFSLASGMVQHTLKPQFSHYLGTQIAEWIRGTAMPSAPSSVQLVLSTADIEGDGTGLDEPPNTDGYQRQNITFGSPTSTVGVGTVLTNDTAVVFGPANTNDWPSVSFGGLMSGSNVLIYGALAVARTAEVGDGIPFQIGTVSFTIR